jgi:hypothetical protein
MRVAGCLDPAGSASAFGRVARKSSPVTMRAQENRKHELKIKTIGIKKYVIIRTPNKIRM